MTVHKAAGRARCHYCNHSVPLPINLDTVNRLYGLNLTSFEMEKFLESVAEHKDEVAQLMAREGELLLAALPKVRSGLIMVALDQRGKALSSEGRTTALVLTLDAR